MGRQLSVPVGREPDWARLAEALKDAGETVALRMIDGLPAFPEEIPEPGWAELRLALSGGMVTLRRMPGEIMCTTWGTDDPALQQSLDACAAAVARAVDR